MEVNNCKVSVVIPCYNQARYLPDAVTSVLAQTYTDFEIIVVDDGSMDDTSAVAKQYGSKIHYLWQNNEGLAGARNTGIRQARGEYVALLDSDDQWLPSFLETIISLATQPSGADAYYSGWRYMDQAGRELPQPANTLVIAPTAMYKTLLRANFLIPSTMVLRRSTVMAAGLFDQSLKSMLGCEDWDLWLRLAPAHVFIGVAACLVRYRLHDGSLSDNVLGMQRAALTVIEKHFGPDDGRWKAWSNDKRRAYGGVYRYHTLSSILRQNDWQSGAVFLRKALVFDSTLAADLDLFYELALGTQPLGYRGVLSRIDFDQSTQNLVSCLQTVFGFNPLPLELKARRAEAYSYAYLALGLLAYGCRRLIEARRFLLLSVRLNPHLARHPQVLPKFAKSLLGSRLLDKLKRSTYASADTSQ